MIWAGLSGAFFLPSLLKPARGLGLLRGFEGFLRDILKQGRWYEDRRSLQIAANIAVVVIALIVWRLLWAWHYIKRYRLAIGFMGLTLGFAIYYSLHFSARSRRMVCECAMGAHCRGPRRRCRDRHARVELSCQSADERDSL